jgi:hypothetical protein
MENIFKECEVEIGNNNVKKNGIINECIRRKSSIIKNDLDNKLKVLKKNKFTRYFTKHKGRTFIILCIVIFLLICIFMPEPIPIDGGIDDSNILRKLLSLIGFLSSNLLLALLVSIIGVETFLSREELSEIRNQEKKFGLDILVNARKKLKNSGKNKIKKLKDLINKIQNKSSSNYVIKKIPVNTTFEENIIFDKDTNKVDGKNEIISNINNINLDFDELNSNELNSNELNSNELNSEELNKQIDNHLNIIELSIKNDISLDEEDILEIITELDNITNE